MNKTFENILSNCCISVFAFYLFSLVSCNQKNTLFTLLESKETGIKFNNTITENDSLNILVNEYVYNGGGVAIADFNNDSLPDVYFTGNMVSNKMYLNKGSLKFEDVTEKANVTGNGKWCSGVAVVDINADGWKDLYVCVTLQNDPEKLKNLLYVNQGLLNGFPIFKEMAEQYGLADTTHSTNAAFLDYDKDGDLDCYILVDKLEKFPNKYHEIVKDGTGASTGRLYECIWPDTAKHPVYTDVSKKTGITTEGYGLGVNVSDINADGWPDIYVTNDYITNDLIYINNKNGTFTNKASAYLKHTSFSAMGNDVADINNDGLKDIIAVDMLPEDNFRKKMMLNANNYSAYLNVREFNYMYQYVRNTVQLNLGNAPLNDSNNHPIFGDIAYYSGLSSTDWSWCPMVTDFDNDGFKDVIITNGFPKDITDHDFIAYRENTKNYAAIKDLLTEIPEVKLKNYAYKNGGNLKFENVTDSWGITKPSFSNGAAYADFDNDGDLDYVVNNINDEAHFYENNQNKNKGDSNNFVAIKLSQTGHNPMAIGAVVNIEYGFGDKQVQENTIYRGYLSSISNVIHFGLGKHSVIGKLTILWPDGNKEDYYELNANGIYNLKKKNEQAPIQSLSLSNLQYFSENSDYLNINYTHTDKDYIDFNIQKLIPHKFSQYGPAISVADINGDDLDDFFVSGSYGNSGKFFTQTKDGTFAEKDLMPNANMSNKQQEDAGTLLFDADNDGDNDLYIASGGYENNILSVNYADRLYVNDGKGNFSLVTNALPSTTTIKSCVKGADIDADGDIDLFVGGRVVHSKYPMPESSQILRNDSKNGVPKFIDITTQIAPWLKNIGLVCDMVFTDFNNDSKPDIIIAGEWMATQMFENKNGKFENVTPSNISNKIGWWNSIAAADLDNDGDMDYICGNLGENSFYKASEKYPSKIYAADFNKDGGYDAIPTLYLPNRQNKMEEFPAFGRDDLIKQMITIKARFTNYNSFALAGIDKILTTVELKDAYKLEANYFKSCIIKNLGNNKFEIIELPEMAQLSPVFGIVANDIDGDGNIDLILNTNDYGTEIFTGNYDALNGLVLKGDGKCNFYSMPAEETGFYVPGNGKALANIKVGDKLITLASQNQGKLLAFKVNSGNEVVQFNKNEKYAVITLLNRKEITKYPEYGSSFNSQSGNYIIIPTKGVDNVKVYNKTGQIRYKSFK